MLNPVTISPSDMAAAAGDAAALMKALSNEHRLLILCHLIAEEEMSVGALVSKIGVSQRLCRSIWPSFATRGW